MSANHQKCQQIIKNVSKSSLAVIILSLLLILSMIVGMTAAWFTAQKTDGTKGDLKFGTVAMTVKEGASGSFSTSRATGTDAYAKVMPGDKLKMDITVAKAEGSDDFYYRLVLTITGLASDGKTPLQLNSGDIAAINTAVGQTYDTSASADKQLKAVEVVLAGQNYDNTWQGATVTVSYEVRAIQKANLTADQATYALNAGWTDVNTVAISA